MITDYSTPREKAFQLVLPVAHQGHVTVAAEWLMDEITKVVAATILEERRRCLNMLRDASFPNAAPPVILAALEGFRNGLWNKMREEPLSDGRLSSAQGYPGATHESR